MQVSRMRRHPGDRCELVGVAAFCCALAAAGCRDAPAEFRCEVSQDCALGETRGTCEFTGYCGFPDPTCPGLGRRYGPHSGPEFSSRCVVGAPGDAAGADAGADAASPICGGMFNPCCDGETCQDNLLCDHGRCIWLP